jgi:hypothetical protein
MTKEIYFDLHFTDLDIAPISHKAVSFLGAAYRLGLDRSTIYQCAVEQGLHVKFETATVRDSVTGA